MKISENKVGISIYCIYFYFIYICIFYVCLYLFDIIFLLIGLIYFRKNNLYLYIYLILNFVDSNNNEIIVCLFIK